MSWKYRDIRTFPAYFPETLRTAVAQINTPILLVSSPHQTEIDRITAQFRWWRWCLRKKPEIDPVLSGFELTYQLRLQTDKAGMGLVTYLTAKPTKISDLLEHNPALSDLILAQCQ